MYRLHVLAHIRRGQDDVETCEKWNGIGAIGIPLPPVGGGYRFSAFLARIGGGHTDENNHAA